MIPPLFSSIRLATAESWNFKNLGEDAVPDGLDSLLSYLTENWPICKVSGSSMAMHPICV